MSALELARLSVDERLDLIAELWDSLDASDRETQLSAAHLGELDSRLDELDREGPAGIPSEVAMQKLRRRLK